MDALRFITSIHLCRIIMQGFAAVAVIGLVVVAIIVIAAFVSCICTRIFISSKQSSLHHCRDLKTTKLEGGINENPELRKVELPSICPICLEGYKEDDRLRDLPDCHNLFHEKCIDPWLELQPTCPVCRRLSPVPTPTTTPIAEVAPPREV